MRLRVVNTFAEPLPYKVQEYIGRWWNSFWVDVAGFNTEEEAIACAKKLLREAHKNAAIVWDSNTDIQS